MLVSMMSLVFLAGPSPKEGPLDALDFDNGAVLVSESGSYGTDIGSWSAWRLTDGDATLGWCSPDGKPLGGTFVWDLDTVWRLDTFVISNENDQEDGWPGISAKSVELFVSAGEGAAFTKVGAFTVGKLKKASFPLKGVKAKRVKLVVTGNHGNDEYTEIAELDLLGARTEPVTLGRLAGDFDSSYGLMRLVQDGASVYGCYGDDGFIWGSVEGRCARVTWSQGGGEAPVREGTATFVVRPGGDLFGLWYEGGELAGIWSGPRSSASPTCTPRRRGNVSRALKKNGRAVLYGVHFASASDVPLEDSTPALEELAQALKEAPSERVLVEGHTDSTNTDAFNLDLSQRRAKSVVDWLIKHGVEPKRLEPKGFGRAKPVADNGTAQGRALNRRVEVSVVK